MADTQLVHRIVIDERLETLRRRTFWVNLPAAVLALTSFVLFHGEVFPAHWEAPLALFQALCLIAMIAETVGVYVVARNLREGWKYSQADTIALLAGVVLGLALFLCSDWVSGLLDAETTLAAFAYLTQAGVLAFVFVRLLRVFSFISRLAQSPLRVFIGSFIALILLGSGLLMLPGAHTGQVDITYLDALFTSTSATCVTGLVVVDTPSAWSRFGQTVIIALVQAGGLGIMTFAAFFGLMFGRGLGIKDAAAVGEVLNMNMVGRVGKMTAWILGSTIAIELIGTALLYGQWTDAAGNSLPPAEQLYYSAFHSISAFCNAGFALYSDSMVRYVGHWPVVLSISWLVVMGGLGFLVIMEVCTFRWWATPSIRRLPLFRRRVKNQQLPRVSLQTKIILVATASLLLLGAIGFIALEWNYTLRGLDFDDKVAAAIFQSMAARTAGFNSIDTTQTSAATQFWTILLMIVGGSPGSVAGGIKTTTFVVMILAVVATFRGRPAEIFKRRIPATLIHKSLVMLVLLLTLICFSTLALAITESDASSKYGFEQILFEATSAFCTVGLSSGASGELTLPGKLIIIVCMFVGRIGPLTLVLAIGARSARRFEYPEESIMIG